jgi:hypothetical protein
MAAKSLARALAAILPIAAVAAVVAPGCGNDFDALFVSTNGASTDGAVLDVAPGPGPSDAGSSARDAPVEAGPGQAPDAALCAPTVPTCARKAGCSDGVCTNTCEGCGCTCAEFDCDNSSATQCTTTCSGGPICDVDCEIEGACSLVAHATTHGRMSCDADVKSCTLTCDQGGACELECRHVGPCAAGCAPGTTCLVVCGSNVTSCAVDCQGGQRRECPNGVVTCNLECPN